MVMNELDWPGVSFVRSEVTQSPQWASLRELQPLFNRKPHGDWCELFFQSCEEDSSIDWKEAGFALCKPDDVSRVEERFHLATAEANTGFRAYLAGALADQPRETTDLIALEASLAGNGNGDDAYLCNFTGDI